MDLAWNVHAGRGPCQRRGGGPGAQTLHDTLRPPLQLQHEHLAGACVLIYANKQDVVSGGSVHVCVCRRAGAGPGPEASSVLQRHGWAYRVQPAACGQHG